MAVFQGKERGVEELILTARAFAPPEKDVSTGFDPVAEALSDIGLQDMACPHGVHGGLVSAVLDGRKPLLWVQDLPSRLEYGVPHAALARGGARSADMVLAPVRNARDALWAMEEAVKAGVDVVGEIEGCPRILDFTATRRLELFSRASGARCLLVRTGPGADMGGSSGARWRWRVEPEPSDVNPHDARAPGRARWRLDLLRARSRPPGRWVVEAGGEADDADAPHRLRLVSPLAAGDVEARAGPEAAAVGGAASNVIYLRRDQKGRAALS